MIIVPYVDSTLYQFYRSKSKPRVSLSSTEKVFLKYKKIHLLCRNTTILPFHVGRIWQVSNGQRFRKLQVTEAIVGLKVGEFVPTRASYYYKKKKQKWGKKMP